MSEILQGTTPSLEVTIKKADFLVTDVIKLEFTIRYNFQTRKYGLSDVTADAVKNSFTYTFSEAETLSMKPGMNVDYQLRFLFSDGHILGTKQMHVAVEDLISKDVMSE